MEKEQAKGLYPDADKTKLTSIEAGAQKNIAPKHKTLVLQVAQWKVTGNLYEYVVSDTDVTDGCYVAIVVENDSVVYATEASFLSKPTFRTGGFSLFTENKPTGNINLTYSIIV
ncbi:MAG: hypothetical protein LUD02_01615 [Tannerellaceae bacterium]|nr:hypothetical protein [Tannerellaceae bacterium]MCD8262996.1 hypothetical protein [Tannerellaceae bacterium]